MRTRIPRKNRAGFTLIELMIVVAILAVLALIAIPKFAQLVEKSREAGTLGHLGHIRSALLLYYMENDQSYPNSFADMIQPNKKYINDTAIPLYTGDHLLERIVDDIPDLDPAGDTGHWSYVSSGDSRGYFYIQCVHTDMKQNIWSTH
jgi:prepilin-type N-terminal cleavage/methylation domain-containing protein